MNKITYIIVLAALLGAMLFFGSDLIGQPPPPGGAGNNDLGSPGAPINLTWPLILTVFIFLSVLFMKRKSLTD